MTLNPNSRWHYKSSDQWHHKSSYRWHRNTPEQFYLFHLTCFFFFLCDPEWFCFVFYLFMFLTCSCNKTAFICFSHEANPISSAVGMVSKPAPDSAPEFNITQEEFPALPGSQSEYQPWVCSCQISSPTPKKKNVPRKGNDIHFQNFVYIVIWSVLLKEQDHSWGSTIYSCLNMD